MAWAIKTLVGLAAIAVIALALQWGPANASYFAVYYQLQAWAKTGLPTEPELIDAHANINTALAKHPNNAHYHVTKGKVHEWHGLYLKTNNQDNREQLEQALAVYNTAATLREKWPETYINIVNVKIQLEQFDGDLVAAIKQAENTGPYTQRLSLILSKLLLLHWQKMNAELIQLVIPHLTKTIKSGKKGELQSYARLLGQTNFLCQMVKVNEPELVAELKCS